jgi:hypothetical protein
MTVKCFKTLAPEEMSTHFQACVLVCLILARVGNDGKELYFGSNNNEFLGKGVVVGYAIIVPAILLTYLLGANLTILVRAFNGLAPRHSA